MADIQPSGSVEATMMVIAHSLVIRFGLEGKTERDLTAEAMAKKVRDAYTILYSGQVPTNKY